MVDETADDFLHKVWMHSFGTWKVRIDGKDYTYHLMAAAFEKKVPNFVGWAGDDFLISIEVPERFRQAFIAHEVHCSAGKDRGHEGHCLAAIEFELRFVAPADRTEYLALRRKFFDDLIAYVKDKDEPVFLREITASRNYLRGIT
jgi:hypothetical protein